MLYFAYGSNLNVAAMKRRCPKAKKVGRLILPNAKLVFRGVADVIWAPKSRCPGGLWEITRKCEAALDRYEGVASGLYRKEYLTVRLAKGGEPQQVLVYLMNSDGVMPPWEEYIDTIAQGYRDFGLDRYLCYLDQALEHSWAEKNKTRHLHRRWVQKGRPPLAQLEG
jgi:hypothetical protein